MSDSHLRSGKQSTHILRQEKVTSKQLASLEESETGDSPTDTRQRDRQAISTVQE
jgi:hypothetical protein